MAQTSKQSGLSGKRKRSPKLTVRGGAMKTTNQEILHAYNSNISLVEDCFGELYDARGKPDPVRRFTWKNHNKIEVQVITYGARITSLKLPNRAGFPEDVALGFESLAGYLFYDTLAMGATVGRTTNAIANATYVADGKQFWVSADADGQHCNGGVRGFDKVNWTPHVNGTQLVLSYCSPHREEGYPGDLLIKIIFQLTETNELKIDITANTTRTTPVDITNMLYFNLAGHDKGQEELLKHIVILNSNCHTPVDPKGFPTGEIQNVVYTRNDFQTPKVLVKVMGVGSNNGFNEHFCVNRGVDQAEAFVARVTHPFTGRIIEIYSNNYGVNFNTAEEFGNGLVSLPSMITGPISTTKLIENEGLFLIIKKLQMYMDTYPELSSEKNYMALQSLIQKLLINGEVHSDSHSYDDSFHSGAMNADFDVSIILKPLEMQYLEAMKEAIPFVTDDMDFLKVKDIIADILIRHMSMSSDEEDAALDETHQMISDIYDRQLSYLAQIKTHSEILVRKSAQSNMPPNSVPDYYKDGRIHGKDGVIYKRKSGMCLRTQNYPNATYHKNFPSPILRPHETYKHSITYKFWVQAGNPKKWLDRMEISNNLSFQKAKSITPSNM